MAAAASSEVSIKSSKENCRSPMEGQKGNSTNSGGRRGKFPMVC